jgi:hypothetical protein
MLQPICFSRLFWTALFDPGLFKLKNTQAVCSFYVFHDETGCRPLIDIANLRVLTKWTSDLSVFSVSITVRQRG